MPWPARSNDRRGSRPSTGAVENACGPLLIVTVASLEDAESKLTGALAESGARVISIGPEAVTLEQAFLEVTT